MDHMEFAQLESWALDDTAWDRWVARVEKLLGHSLDGDQKTDGYSLDVALVAFKSGHVPESYAADVARRKAFLVSINDLRDRFEGGEFTK